MVDQLEPPGEQPSAEELRPMEEVARTLLRGVHTLRTYPRENEISRIAIDQLVPALTEATPLRLDVRSQNFVWKGTDLLDVSADRAGIVPDLYRDGVRRLEFREGIDAEEIERLVKTLSVRIHPDDLSEDYVTRLWEAQLPHVVVFAVDPYLHDVIQEDVLEGKETPEIDPDEAREAETDIPKPPEEAFRIDDDDAIRLASEVSVHLENLAWSRFVDALVVTLQTPAASRRADEVALLLEVGFQRLLEEGCIADATALVEQLRASVKPTASLLQAVARMAGEDRLAPLYAGLEIGDLEPPTVRPLLMALSPAVVPTLLQFLERTASSTIRGFLMQLVVEIGSPAVEPTLVRFQAGGDPVLRRLLARVLGLLRDPAAVKVLSAELAGAEPALRRELIRSLGMLPSAETTALLLLIAVKDPDTRCRTAALRCLGEGAVQLGPERLIERIESRDRDVGSEERDFLFLALARVGDKGITSFLAEFLQASWIPGRWSRDDARRAAAVLARLPGPEAREALERGARKRRKALARICTDALQALDGEGE